MICPKCGEENLETSNFCKKCATPLKGNLPSNQPKLPRKKDKGILITIGAIVLVVIMIAAANGGNKSTPISANKPTANTVSQAQSTQESSETQTPTQTPTPTPQQDITYNINQAAMIKGVEMTVTKVEKSNGSQYNRPKSGKEFVIVSVKIKNTSVENLSYNPFYFKMQNSKGQLEDETFSTVNTDTALQSGELIKDGEVEGTIVYEELINDSGLILQYQDSLFNDGAKIKFKIN